MPSQTRAAALFGVLASLGAGVAVAATDLGLPEARPIALADALAFARSHQPAVLASLARVRTERANAEVPRAQYEPLVGLTAQLLEGTTNNTTASYLTDPFVELPRIGGTPATNGGGAGWKPHASTLLAAGLSQELFDFGRIAAASAAADARVTVAARAADTQRLDIELNVEEAFFAVRAARSILRASEDAYQRALVHRDFAGAGVRSGLRPPIELTRAEADLGRFDTGRIRARGGLSVAQTVLAAAVGAPELALDAADETLTATDLPTLANAIQLGSERDPRLQEAVARLRQRELETRAVGALARPDLRLSAAISGRAGGATPSNGGDVASGSGALPNVPNWDGALVLSWPIFDPTINARVRAARVAEEVQVNELDLVRQQVVAAVEQAYVGVVVAREALPSLQHEVAAARANYAQADARFKAGLGTSVELADAEALRADADIRLAIGIFELAKARASFGRAIAEGARNNP
ncbi:MAG TPA: TolC family protein [Polyangia bacterium]|nr:TolC family protein [Polyangia bacterium]